MGTKQVVAKTQGMPKEEWLALRERGIGGSEAACVMGKNPYRGALTLYREKTGERDRQDLSQKESVRVGTYLEDYVATRFMEETGIVVDSTGEMYRSTEHPYILANVDRIIIGENKGLECKTASVRNADKWSGDNLPNEYYCQCQHYCYVMGWEGIYIACLIGNEDFVYKYIPRSESFIAEMVAKEVEFWEKHVLLKVPPEPTLGDEEFIKAVPEVIFDMIPAISTDAPLLEELKKAKAEKKILDGKIELLEMKLKNRIGTHSGIDGIATWKTTKGREYIDWEAIANEFQPDVKVIEKHTHYRDGCRRLVLK